MDLMPRQSNFKMYYPNFDDPDSLETIITLELVLQISSKYKLDLVREI